MKKRNQKPIHFIRESVDCYMFVSHRVLGSSKNSYLRYALARVKGGQL